MRSNHEFEKARDAIELDGKQGLLSASPEGLHLHFDAPRYSQVASRLRMAGFVWVDGRWFGALNSYEAVRKILRHITPEMCEALPPPVKMGFIAREWPRYNCPVMANEFKPWCAKITGTCSRYGMDREFLHGSIDMAEANSVGSRGVRIIWTEPAGHYQVKGGEFFRVCQEGRISEVSKAEVMESINA